METAATSELLTTLMSWRWALVALLGLLYFVSCYLFEILAQKLEQPRWMAWVPFANAYLMFLLVGWEKWFVAICAGYALGFAAMFAPGPLMMLGGVVMVATVLAVLVLGLIYWPRLAVRRGLSVGTGLLIVLPQPAVPLIEWLVPGSGLWLSLLASAIGVGAFFWIVFHDGRPEAPPHPIGYVLTAVGCLAIGALLHTLPTQLLDDPRFAQSWQALASQVAPGELDEDTGELSASSLLSRISDWSSGVELPEAVRRLSTDDSVSLASIEPAPRPVSKVCPQGARKMRGPREGGRASWCEVPNGDQWIRHGPTRTWFDNGTIASEGSYDHGIRTGTWTRYWRTGGRRVQAEFRRDAQNGWMHRWDARGGFVNGVYYQAGEPATWEPGLSPS